uniref:GST N-terminal domain-containing protein n=1 Tax=Panagrolaimus superbus TaxID=310955 RepID=A0A914YY74_9BILA
MSESLLDLWVKAGADGNCLGGDPQSQQLFMILLLKAQNPDCRFNVRTLNEAKLPQDFKNYGMRHAPALTHGEDIAISHPDEIVEYIDHIFPSPSLKYNNPEADGATADLFRAFCYFIKEVNKDPKALLNELYRLDQYLAHSEYRFLTSDKMQHIDCNILPKLHGIRIASRALKNFEIPVDLNYVWRYLHEGYQQEAFRKSCSSDQEIILYWAERKDTPDLPAAKRSQLSRQKPIFTMEVPRESLLSS